MDKEIFLKLLKKFIEFIKDEGYNIILLLTKTLKKKPEFCKDIKIISDIAIFILWLFLVSSLLWVVLLVPVLLVVALLWLVVIASRLL